MGGIQRAIAGAVVLALLSLTTALPADEKVDLAELVARGAETLRRLQTETATWTAIHQLANDTGVARIEWSRSPQAKRAEIYLVRSDAPEQFMASVIWRDGYWHVQTKTKARKHRPFAAALNDPRVHAWLHDDEPPTLAPHAESIRRATKNNDGTIAVIADFPPRMQASLQERLALVQQLVLTMAEKGYARDKHHARVEEFNAKIERGVRLTVAAETGLILSRELPSPVTFENFRFAEVAPEKFDVAQIEWDDATGDIAGGKPERLAAMMHSPRWLPGLDLEPSKIELRVVNLDTGAMRRVPHRGSQVLGGCLSLDRRKAYVVANDALDASLGPLEIDLATGEERPLCKNFADGRVSELRLSPDGSKLALEHCGHDLNPLNDRLLVIDLASGEVESVGPPARRNGHAWMPDGKSLVASSAPPLHLEEVESLRELYPRYTLSQVRLDGGTEELGTGERPLVLAAHRKILFTDEGYVRTCDLDGGNVAPLAAEFSRGRGFAVTGVSPDGDELLLIIDDDGARVPHIFSFPENRLRRLNLAEGLWAKGSW